jgi:hypothetical protein
MRANAASLDGCCQVLLLSLLLLLLQRSAVSASAHALLPDCDSPHGCCCKLELGYGLV